MYKPDKRSKIHFYVLFFTAVLIGWSFYIFTRPLFIESACNDITLKTTSLVTKGYNLDPSNDYDLKRVGCMNEVLSASN